MKFNSTAIKSATYNDTTATLAVTFTTGAKYRYHGVPRDLYANLLLAPSTGKFFAANIKGCYPFSQSKPLRSTASEG